MNRPLTSFDAVTVTLNPAIDRTLTISGFTPGAVNRVEHFCDHPGGKGVNVASALADGGHKVAVTGFLGSENSRSFEALFAAKRITDHFIRTAGETRIGIKITDPIQRQTTDINFPGNPPAPEEIIDFWKRIDALDAPWFVLSGSLPAGVEPGIYRDLVIRLRSKGCKILVDTSNEPLRQAIEAAPTIIKPNLHELEALLGEPLKSENAVINAARSLVARGIELVVVSMGKEGAVFADAHRMVIARSPDLEVRSTVGAGDAMVAGILSAQIRGLSLENCARMGSAYSLNALTRTGPPSPSVIEATMRQIILRLP